ALDGEFGHLGVLLGGPVEGGEDDLSLHRTLHVGDLFRAFVNQHHHQVALGVVGGDRLGDLLENRGLARLGGRDDQSTLALPDGGDQVDDPGEGGVVLAVHLEAEALVREERGEVFEPGPVAGLLDVAPVDRVDPGDGRKLLLRPGVADRAGDQVALAEPELADLAGRDVDVPVAGQVAGGAQAAVALRQDVEEALADLALARLILGLGLAAATTTGAIAVALATIAVAAAGVAAVVVVIVVIVTVTAVVAVVGATRRLLLAATSAVVAVLALLAPAVAIVTRTGSGGGEIDVGGGI